MKNNTICLRVQDMTRQREVVARDVRRDASWGEALASILTTMALPRNEPTAAGGWAGHLEREGRHLHPSEIVGDALMEDDKIVLHPEVTAG